MFDAFQQTPSPACSAPEEDMSGCRCHQVSLEELPIVCHFLLEHEEKAKIFHPRYNKNRRWKQDPMHL